MKKIIALISMIGLVGCASVIKSMEGDKADLITIKEKYESFVILYHTTGYLSYEKRTSVRTGYHYGNTKPEEVNKILKKSLEWHEKVKDEKKIEKEIESFFSGITYTYVKGSDGSPMVRICFRDTEYFDINEWNCGLLYGEKEIKQAIQKTSKENIKKVEAEIERKKKLKKQLK